MSARRSRVAAVLGAILTATYPLAVYIGLTRFSARGLGLVLLVALVPGLALRIGSIDRARLSAHLWPVLRVPLSVAAIVAVAALLDERQLFLWLPVLINLMLLGQFAASLRAEVSMIERFARLADPELPEGGVAYCRKVTVVWCGFFLVNGAIAGILALTAPIAWWALYTGAIAYGLIGLLFAGEFVVRRAIFRRFGDTLPDRVLAALIGRREPDASPGSSDRGTPP
ncbi:MAG: hypothetical protein KC636_10930 [Myxococcales bacterium]|nr:hypothetical protein [Myxococcales bacterium]